jgi:hypothetical protein
MEGKTLTSLQVKHLQTFVRGVLVFGILMSVSANVVHSITGEHKAQWMIWVGAIASALAPIGLFLTSEMVVRIPIHMAETYDKVLAWIRLLITFAIAGFSGWISYWHMKDVSMMIGERGEAPYLYPLIVDGMMIVATISLLALSRVRISVETVEAAIEAAKAEEVSRKCPDGCECGRHNKKVAAPVIATRKPRAKRVPAQSSASPVSGAPVSV